MAKKRTQNAPLTAAEPMTKDERIQAENARLMALFDGADANKMDFVREQVKQLAFFNVSIVDLQQNLNKWGTLIQYDNGGGQSGVKVNPDVKTLTDYQKLVISIVRSLLPVVPAKRGGGKLADLMKAFDEDDDTDPTEPEEDTEAI